MIIAKVVGNVVATKKEDSLLGKKLMLISPYANGFYSKDNMQVAVDSVGAGIGEVVLIVQGSSARITESTDEKPIDMNIVGIIDEMEIGGDHFFSDEAL
jgi:ethanolamine utilization protein EutN